MTAPTSPGSGDQPVDEYLVVLLVPPAIARRIADARRHLPVGASRLPDPHIVVKAGLRGRGDPTALDQVVAAARATTRPFDLTTTGLRLVDEGELTWAWIDLGRNRALMDLHERLVEDSACFGRTAEDAPGQFRPAIAVAAAPGQGRGAARAPLRAAARAGRFRVEEAGLIRRRADGDWRTIETYPLGEVVI